MVQQIYHRTKESSEKSWKISEKYRHHQWQVYIMERNIYSRLLIYHKKQTTLKKIMESKNDTKNCSTLSTTLLWAKQTTSCQKENGCTVSRSLLHSFLTRLKKKIRVQLQDIDEYIPEVNTSVPILWNLSPMTNEEIEWEILSMKNTCELDIILTTYSRAYFQQYWKPSHKLSTFHLWLTPFH